jgi:hypothetical protein
LPMAVRSRPNSVRTVSLRRRIDVVCAVPRRNRKLCHTHHVRFCRAVALELMCSIVPFVRILYIALIISTTTVVAACVARAAQAPMPTGRAAAVVGTQSELIAEQLELAGLTTEAAAEALRALPTASPEERARYVRLLTRIRDRNRALDAERRSRNYLNQITLADELSRRGLREEARRSYVSAAEAAATTEERNRALGAAQSLATIGVIDGGSGERILSAVRTIVDNGLAAVMVVVGLVGVWMGGVRPALARLEKLRRGVSKTAVIQNFHDSTNTGLGRGLPDLIRTIYREQQELRTLSPGGSVLVPFHVAGGFPVLSAPAAESDFPWTGLSVAGAPVKDILARWFAVWNAPWSSTSGTIYQMNQDVRVSISIVTHGEEPVAWDSSLQEGVNPPRDAAYRVVFTLFEQWERRHG